MTTGAGDMYSVNRVTPNSKRITVNLPAAVTAEGRGVIVWVDARVGPGNTRQTSHARFEQS